MTPASQGEPCPPSLRETIRRNKPPALQVTCPHCHTPPGQPCRAASGRLLHQAHATRYEAAGLPTRLTTDTGP
ncbi:hypothetical protein GCM10010193_69540 [Kitasatospora atroaurantiaca]|uniref:DNA-binding phage zinc finger domain-containing protein n=1 Tax=Kitasatospora atroaurantiaca TaxID=285545 RepID=A0A561EN43_9ACTN|nr:hypothetical protein FB465_2045 [Kitasatospora atroaurantiaca]